MFFEDSNVRITNTLTSLGGAFYALASITSVRAVTEGRPLSALVGMLVCGFAGVVFSFRSTGCGGAFLFIALVLVLIYFAAFQTKHHVCIGTAGAETNSVWFKRRDQAEDVVAALNAAIVARG